MLRIQTAGIPPRARVVGDAERGGGGQSSAACASGVHVVAPLRQHAALGAAPRAVLRAALLRAPSQGVTLPPAHRPRGERLCRRWARRGGLTAVGLARVFAQGGATRWRGLWVAGDVATR